MPKTDERYDEVKQWSTSLTDIAKNIEIITFQDSLIRISQMTEEEKRALAARIKATEGKKTEAKKRGKKFQTTNSKNEYNSEWME